MSQTLTPMPQTGALSRHASRAGAQAVGSNAERALRASFPLALCTLGSDRAFPFLTVELTKDRMFVACEDYKRTPFRVGESILQAQLRTHRLFEGATAQVTTTAVTRPDASAAQAPTLVTFLGKITTVVDRAMARDLGTTAGFELKIVQISFENAQVLERLVTTASDAEFEMLSANLAPPLSGETRVLDALGTTTL